MCPNTVAALGTCCFGREFCEAYDSIYRTNRHSEQQAAAEAIDEQIRDKCRDIVQQLREAIRDAEDLEVREWADAATTQTTLHAQEKMLAQKMLALEHKVWSIG